MPGGTSPSSALPSLSVTVMLAAGAVVLILLSVGLLLFPRGEAWQSRATLLIDQPQAIAVSQNPGIIEKLSRLRFKYAGLVGTRDFADRMENDGTPVEGGQLLTSVPADSLLVHVGARGERGAVQPLANAAAQALVGYVEDELDDAQVTPEHRFGFEIVSPATDATKLDESRRGIAIALLGAGVVAAGGAVATSRTR